MLCEGFFRCSPACKIVLRRQLQMQVHVPLARHTLLQNAPLSLPLIHMYELQNSAADLYIVLSTRGTGGESAGSPGATFSECIPSKQKQDHQTLDECLPDVGGGACRRWEADEAAGAPEGCDACIPAAPPPDSRGLPVHGPAGAYRRHHGHLQLCTHRCASSTFHFEPCNRNAITCLYVRLEVSDPGRPASSA